MNHLLQAAITTLYTVTLKLLTQCRYKRYVRITTTYMNCIIWSACIYGTVMCSCMCLHADRKHDPRSLSQQWVNRVLYYFMSLSACTLHGHAVMLPLPICSSIVCIVCIVHKLHWVHILGECMYAIKYYVACNTIVNIILLYYRYHLQVLPVTTSTHVMLGTLYVRHSA